ncbi:MAG TPA: NAD-dependent succinate-semialdehyde dehydrogenase [Xanthobacteraceae bacterium]|nr:NAD-dependent succinate-semialdehyde dehydrogenase [Xanthobacteraceae bacterium]
MSRQAAVKRTSQFTSINPATGQEIASYDEMERGEVARIIERANAAFLDWRRKSFAERAKPMKAAAKILRDRAAEFGKLMAEEMGKPISDGIAEAQKCATGCDFFAENAEKFLAREEIATDAKKSFVTYQPLGVVLAIMPWNFPFWQVFRFAAPGLMAGNAGVLKHASNVMGCALVIEKVFQDAGFPAGLFRTLLVSSRQIDGILENPLIRAATLTGSDAAGRAVASKAGAMLKKTVLELGGSDAYVVLDDADLEKAAGTSVKGRLVNGGQSCIAAKRFIVTEKTRAKFEELFVEKMRAIQPGDPMDKNTKIGPMARHDLRDALHAQVEKSVAKGAKLLLGGKVPAGPGAFYPPTVLTGVKKGMAAYEEELFGPVAAIIAVKDEAEALKTANDSVFGLGGAILSSDIARAEKLAAEEMEAGSVFVNEAVKSDARLPFGGIKQSGYGRELSVHGIREFVNIKTVYVA